MEGFAEVVEEFFGEGGAGALEAFFGGFAGDVEVVGDFCGGQAGKIMEHEHLARVRFEFGHFVAEEFEEFAFFYVGLYRWLGVGLILRSRGVARRFPYMI